MSNQLLFDAEAREKLLSGAEKLGRAVSTTLGPKGQNVLLYMKGQSPVITKDGVSVARVVTLDDPLEQAGVDIVRQAAIETNNVAGDGTTTATVLACEILKKAKSYITSGTSPIDLKRGLDVSLSRVLDALDEMSQPIKDEEGITHVATVSAGGDGDLGGLVAEAVLAAGKDGAVTIEESKSLETTLDVVEGFQFDGGFVSSQFITDERRGCVSYNDVLFLVTDETLDSIDEMLPILEVVARDGRPFVIVAEEVEGQLLAALIMNRMRGQMKIAAIKAPRYGEERRNMLEDIATATGATFISKDSGIRLSTVEIAHLGTAKSVEILKGHTTIVDGGGDEEDTEKIIESLKSRVESCDSLHEAERLQDRITRLASGVSVIRVGGATEVEMVEKKHRVEDALEAVRSAQLEGVVPGGGMALAMSSLNLKGPTKDTTKQQARQILYDACQEPLRMIFENAGLNPDITLLGINQLKQQNPHVPYLGLDVASNKTGDMLKMGIIDPTKVTKTALTNAVSVAGTLLTTNCIVYKEQSEENKK